MWLPVHAEVDGLLVKFAGVVEQVQLLEHIEDVLLGVRVVQLEPQGQQDGHLASGHIVAEALRQGLGPSRAVRLGLISRTDSKLDDLAMISGYT